MKVVALASVLTALVLGAAGIGVALLLSSGTRAESASTPLVAWQLIRAGTTGERILRQQRRPMYRSVSVLTPRRNETRQQELIYDWEYLRGRVAIVDIFPGAMLTKADFRP